jgi:hypothetical protein
MDNLQNTINQLLSVQKQSIEKNLGFSPENQAGFIVKALLKQVTIAIRMV